MSIPTVRKPRGRPPVGAIPVTVRIPPDALARLDAWISDQPEPMLTRPEAIRLILREKLTDRKD